jgi:hypothetical protein
VTVLGNADAGTVKVSRTAVVRSIEIWEVEGTKKRRTGVNCDLKSYDEASQGLAVTV